MRAGGTKLGVEPGESRQGAKQTLFVEGNESSIDSQVLETLFTENGINITIVPLGSSSKLLAVAKALHPYYPYYYFLIDRDHHNDETVESYWKDFPDESKHNLLIWRRREIENYFLVPEYLAGSEYLEKSREELQQCIRETASEYVFRDIANVVILQLRAELRKTGLNHSKTLELLDLAGEMKYLPSLRRSMKLRNTRAMFLNNCISIPSFERFDETVSKFFGGQDELEFGHGSWLEMVRGKCILPTVIDKCFRVQDAKGKYLQGKECRMEVVKSLLKLPLKDQPPDFNELYTLILARVLKRA
jgi:hypothetical protein